MLMTKNVGNKCHKRMLWFPNPVSAVVNVVTAQAHGRSTRVLKMRLALIAYVNE